MNQRNGRWSLGVGEKMALQSAGPMPPLDAVALTQDCTFHHTLDLARSEAEGKMPVRLGTVQQTLLVPLWARAMEASEPAPVLRDPTAEGILSRLDFDFTPLSSARASQLGC